MEALTATEAKSLTSCERTIEKGLKTCFEVGEALAHIRDNRLYRGSHKTFETYCQDRWGWSRQRASQLILASEIEKGLSTTVDKPKNEAHSRPLSKLPKEDRSEVWERAVASAPKDEDGEPVITVKHVEKTVQEWVDPEPEQELETDVHYDYLEQPLTDQQAAVFDHEPLIDETIGLLKAVQRNAKQLSETTAGKFLNLKLLRAATKDAIGYLEATRPYALCPYCDGRKCTACANVGIVPKEVLEQAQ